MKFNPKPLPVDKVRKLEIGTHARIDPSWEVMDMVLGENVDIVADIRKPLTMVKDSSYDLVYMSHLLEHVPWFQTVDVLKEIYRILRNKGIVEIWVPNFDRLIEAYLNHDLIKNDGWFKHNPEHDPYVWINGRIFTYGPGDNNWHRAVFNEEHLSNCLKRAGFTEIFRLKKPRGYDHGWINMGMGGKKSILEVIFD